MTDTDTSLPIELSPGSFMEVEAPSPEPIEEHFQNRGLKVLYWSVGETERENPDDTDTAFFADLTVLYGNGKRVFRSIATINIDVIYGLVGTDEIESAMIEQAVTFLIEHGEQVDPYILEVAEEDEGFAKSLSAWTLTDADLVRAAAANAPRGWDELLLAAAPLIEQISITETSYTTPEAQFAAVVMKIAWDLL